MGKVEKAFTEWRWRQAKKIMSEVHDLNYFFWESTLRCNLQCRHCGSDCRKNPNVPDLPASQILAVFQDISQHYDPQKIMVAVTGGEPLLREDLFEILFQVKEMGFPWGMVTNGMLVNNQTVEKCLAAGMRTVSVSLDGLKESHNWLRNNDMSYERAINALKLFNDSNLDIVEAITCVNKRNINELNDIYSILKENGIKQWRIITIFPQGRAENKENLVINKNLLIELFSFIKDKKRNDSELLVSYSEEGYLGCDWEREVRDELFYCGAGVNVAGLLCDGSFSACPSLSRGWIQGHVDEATFSEVWETKYKNMRNRNWMKNEECTNCKAWKNCQGSSLHLWDWELSKPKICHYKMLNFRS